MTRFSYATGAAVAMLAAGPVCILTALIGAALFDGPSFTGAPTNPLLILMLMLISMPFGLAIALLPILLGGYAMARLGHSYPDARQPLLWAASGTTIGATMAMEVGPDWRGGALFAVTGAVCALIVRYFTCWSDESA